MHIRTIVVAVVLLALPAYATAQTWSSPDGFLSVTPPEGDNFQAIPSPPAPFLGLWVSNDESMKFAVLKVEIPSTVKLIQSSAEQGLAEEVGGEVTRLPTRKLSGHEVWSMTAKGPSTEVTQALVRHDGALYKVMAATVGDAGDTESVQRFVESLSIAAQPNAVPPRQSAAQPVQDLNGGVDLHKLSKTFGGAGALIGIGLLVYLVMRGKKTRP